MLALMVGYTVTSLLRIPSPSPARRETRPQVAE